MIKTGSPGLRLGLIEARTLDSMFIVRHDESWGKVKRKRKSGERSSKVREGVWEAKAKPPTNKATKTKLRKF